LAPAILNVLAGGCPEPDGYKEAQRLQVCDGGFRRGLSTNLKTLGVDDTVIQRILRHANMGVTRQSYIKIEDHVKTAAMKKLQGSLRARIKARKANKKNAPRRSK
jgi:hypothetical protein